MNPPLHNFRESLLQRLLDFLWRQWSALGVAGHSRTRSGRTPSSQQATRDLRGTALIEALLADLESLIP